MEEISDAFMHLKHNKHEVILFHVTDKKHELDFEFDNRLYTFVDMEDLDEIIESHLVNGKVVERLKI